MIVDYDIRKELIEVQDDFTKYFCNQQKAGVYPLFLSVPDKRDPIWMEFALMDYTAHKLYKVNRENISDLESVCIEHIDSCRSLMDRNRTLYNDYSKKMDESVKQIEKISENFIAKIQKLVQVQMLESCIREIKACKETISNLVDTLDKRLYISLLINDLIILCGVFGIFYCFYKFA